MIKIAIPYGVTSDFIWVMFQRARIFATNLSLNIIPGAKGPTDLMHHKLLLSLEPSCNPTSV